MDLLYIAVCTRHLGLFLLYDGNYLLISKDHHKKLMLSSNINLSYNYIYIRHCFKILHTYT